MENPATWNLLTSSLAVCDLQMPEKVWAFLALQGLVRDLPGDRDFFTGIIQQEKGSGAITGPSLQSRIAGRLEEFGIALANGLEADANAVQAKKRLQAFNDLLADREPLNVRDPFQAKEAVRVSQKSPYCMRCGVEVEQGSQNCRNCGNSFSTPQAAQAKHCQGCLAMNPHTAIHCYRCGQRFTAKSADRDAEHHILFDHSHPTGFTQTFRTFCGHCGMENHPGYKFCRRCGGLGAPQTFTHFAGNAHVTNRTGGPGKRNTADLQETNYWHTRLFRLIDNADDDKDAADLLAVLFSAIQDLVVMKQLLKEKGVWDEEHYKKLRVACMIADHSSAGAIPWQSYSYYPYTLEEEELLEKVFNASKEEIEKFKQDIEIISELS
jgi:ribosomal protein L40E